MFVYKDNLVIFEVFGSLIFEICVFFCIFMVNGFKIKIYNKGFKLYFWCIFLCNKNEFEMWLFIIIEECIFVYSVLI